MSGFQVKLAETPRETVWWLLRSKRETIMFMSCVSLGGVSALRCFYFTEICVTVEGAHHSGHSPPLDFDRIAGWVFLIHLCLSLFIWPRGYIWALGLGESVLSA